MGQPITYQFADFAHYTSMLGTASANIADAHSDLKNLASILLDEHHGQHAAEWQVAIQQINTALAHFAETVQHFGTTHDNVAMDAMNTDAQLASGISFA